MLAFKQGSVFARGTPALNQSKQKIGLTHP